MLSSAGVYNSDGKLVRTLWSAVENHPNEDNPEEFWDKRLDALYQYFDAPIFAVAPSGTYTIKVLKHACTYEWEGVVGNNSPDTVDNLLYHGHYSPITDMTINDDGEMYFSTGYDERWLTTHVSRTDNHLQVNPCGPYGFRTTDSNTVGCDSDGILVYFVKQVDANNFHVYAYSCAPYEYPPEENFINGTGYPGEKNRHTFSVTGNHTCAITTTGQYTRDIAVQRIGSFLFVSRVENTGTGALSILTLNKTTGVILQTNLMGYANQSSICVDPTNDDFLWVTYSTGSNNDPRDKISKLQVDGSGVITETGVHITGLGYVFGMAVSPDGSMLLVADGGADQQVKAFNTSDGTVKSAWGSSGTFGTLGGYLNSPLVSRTKFSFHDELGGSWIAFEADGSWWLEDSGNYRSMKFTAGNSPVYADKEIQYLPGFYACRVCHNDPTRVFVKHLEFEIDYSLPLAPYNGSWTLKRNWGSGLPDSLNVDFYQMLKHTITASNGRTYTTVDNPANNNRYIWEMTSTGFRDTGRYFGGFAGFHMYVDRDFNVWFPGSGLPFNQKGLFQKAVFTGFDGSANPTWAQTIEDDTWRSNVVLTTEDIPADFPAMGLDTNRVQDVCVPLSNNVAPFFDQKAGYETEGYRIGAIDTTTGEIMWKAMPPTPTNHGQDARLLLWPEEKNYWPRGNGAVYGGGFFFYLPNTAHIFFSHSGESWGNNQTNMIHHWHESGLMVQRFGVAAPYFAQASLLYPNGSVVDDTNAYFSFRGMAELAGNSFQGGVCEVAGKYYLYQNDEMYHGGLHRWKVDNLASINITDTVVVWDDDDYVAPTPNSQDLLSGLTKNKTNLVNGDGGWERFPTTDQTDGDLFNGPLWTRVGTNAVVCSPFKSPDIFFRATSTTTDCYIRKSFTRTLVGDWRMNARVIMQAYPQGGRSIVTIQDSAGKVIVDLTNNNIFPLGLGFFVNRTHAVAGPFANESTWTPYCGRLHRLIVSADVDAGQITVTYGDHSTTVNNVYEIGANIADPARVEVLYDVSLGGAPDMQMAISELEFEEVPDSQILTRGLHILHTHYRAQPKIVGY